MLSEHQTAILFNHSQPHLIATSCDASKSRQPQIDARGDAKAHPFVAVCGERFIEENEDDVMCDSTEG